MQRISRQALQEDIQQLAQLLIETHPDPYTAGGGALAFHRRVHMLLTELPEDGLTREQFLRYARPLVASVRDGHTRLLDPEDVDSGNRRPWLQWRIIEEDLYLARTYHTEQEGLIGARLLALNGMDKETLLQRMGEIQGYDNVYQNLHNLAQSLECPAALAALLKQEEPPTEFCLTLLLVDGSQREIHVSLQETQPGIPLEADSAFTLPPLNAARMCRAFLDARHRVAYLCADSLLYYRENFEYMSALGYTQYIDDWLEDVRRGLPPDSDFPEARDERIALVPSATELLRDLFSAMRLAHTTTLIIDLRFCSGGNSFFATMLTYFLYGVKALQEENEAYQIKRYSPLYFENYTQDSPERHAEAMRNWGYDYVEEEQWRRYRKDASTTRSRLQALADLRESVKRSPTFAKEFKSRAYEAAWTPKVYVLTSAQTYSAGFDTAVTLSRHGAELVGTPPAQAGNCFTDTLGFTLQYSRLRGNISFKRQVLFPQDPEKGNVLHPQHELSYAYLVEHHYDPNAAIQLVLDMQEG